jgi:RNA polymerase sigma-70 factor (ECF subfamily)
MSQPTAASATPTELSSTLAALRAGDERAFERLFEAHHGALVRFGTRYAGSASAAEELAQETWLAFLQSLDRFEGRASLKTWLFRILINCARKRHRIESRSVPLSALGDTESDDFATVALDRFQSEGIWAGHWSTAPKTIGADGERKLLDAELRQRMLAAIDALPPTQREVITLRDVEGFGSDAVCALLEITENNQRVLLHRARSRVREVLEVYLDTDRRTT